MLGKTRHIHLVGIGGVGMSGIAKILLSSGFSVS
ncbi:MAG: Mur ligase domain-containing protein, partial [Candidatus Poribacteria bacterium]